MSATVTPVRSSASHGRDRARCPSPRGSTPATARADERAERLDPELARLLLARDHERRRAVVDAARVARGDRAARPEGRLQRRELLDVVSRPRVLVDASTLADGATISSAKRPASCAAAQRRCDRSANASWSSRETPHRSATFSPVSPIDSSGNSASQPRVGEAPAERRVVHRAAPRANGGRGFAATNGARRHALHAARDEQSPSPARRRGRRRSPPPARTPQRRFTVTPATESGNPASSTAIRATFGCPRPPGWRSRAYVIDSAPARLRADRLARATSAARSSGRTPASAPP